ncbi:MAG: LpxD N-terminal domain-containing protein, partial [Candidatus Adiutrix sp.]
MSGCTMITFTQARPLKQIVETAAEKLIKHLEILGAGSLNVPWQISGDENCQIVGLAAADEAKPGFLTFANDLAYFEKAKGAGANAVIVNSDLSQQIKNFAPSFPLVICPEPRLMFAVMLELAAPVPTVSDDQKNAYFDDRSTVAMGPNVRIGAGAFIGRNVHLGGGTQIAPRAVIESDVTIGQNCIIHSGVVLRSKTKIGNRCQIHCGAIIGDDGFGYTQVPAPSLGRLFNFKNVHAGGVTIEDDVEIGSNTCIDRGLV